MGFIRDQHGNITVEQRRESEGWRRWGEAAARAGAAVEAFKWASGSPKYDPQRAFPKDYRPR